MSEKQQIAPTKKNNSTYLIIGSVVLVLLGGGGYYYYNNVYAASKSSSSSNSSSTGFGGRGGPGGPGGAGGNFANQNIKNITGTILNLSGKQLTVEDASGNTSLVVVSDTTRITKNTAADSSILTTDASVMVDFQKQDNIYNATKITLTPAPTNVDNPQNPNGGTPPPGGNRRNGGQFSGGNASFSQGNNPNVGTTLRGKITKISGNTIILSTFNNQTQDVVTSPTTTYFKTDTASVSDLAKGQNIQVIATNANNINTARSVAITN